VDSQQEQLSQVDFHTELMANMEGAEHAVQNARLATQVLASVLGILYPRRSPFVSGTVA
jgi:hypothetical protein